MWFLIESGNFRDRILLGLDIEGDFFIYRHHVFVCDLGLEQPFLVHCVLLWKWTWIERLLCSEMRFRFDPKRTTFQTAFSNCWTAPPSRVHRT